MEDCVFCKIIKGEIPVVKLWDDKDYFTFLDNSPIQPGHTLVLPKKHTDYFFDLNDEEYTALMLKSKEIAKILKAKLKPKRVGVIVEGFGVAHVHIHLIPINLQYELMPKDRKLGTQSELEKVAKIILG